MPYDICNLDSVRTRVAKEEPDMYTPICGGKVGWKVCRNEMFIRQGKTLIIFAQQRYNSLSQLEKFETLTRLQTKFRVT